MNELTKLRVVIHKQTRIMAKLRGALLKFSDEDNWDQSHSGCNGIWSPSSDEGLPWEIATKALEVDNVTS